MTSPKRPKFIVRRKPRPYPLTEHQKAVRDICAQCGIVKGISRAEMTEKMKNCIPEAWKKKREAEARTELTPPS
jgi:hypothetical protein